MRNRFRHLKWVMRLLLIGAQVSAPLFLLSPAQAAELDEIRERGYLIVAVKDNLRPLGFRGETGQLEGLEIDLARQLAAELLGDPQAVEFRPVANSDRLAVVLDDTVDLAIAHISSTGPRSRLVDFSVPYYLDGTAFVTRDPAVQRLSDLSQQPIAVLNGSATIAVVRSQLPSTRLVGVDSYQAAYALLESNQVRAFASIPTIIYCLRCWQGTPFVLPCRAAYNMTI
jgi:polar amino acid transport system substrate-binding protein